MRRYLVLAIAFLLLAGSLISLTKWLEQAGIQKSRARVRPAVAVPRRDVPRAAQAVPTDAELGIRRETVKLHPPAQAANDWFGVDVAIDGTLMLVGFTGDDSRGPDFGSAYLYRRDETATWVHVAILAADDLTRFSRFGTSVALAGGVALVGAELEREDTSDRLGAVYVFEEAESGQWEQVAKLKPKDAHANQMFGSDVSLSGNIAVIGAEQDMDAGTDAGAAYVFQRRDDGTWFEVAKLRSQDGQEHDQLGATVAVSGTTAVVGSRHNDDNTGSAYVFEPDASGSWRQVAKLKAEDRRPFDQFAISVGISGDRVIVGKWRDSEVKSKSGAAYIFQREADRTWTQAAKLKARDVGKNRNFGYAVGIRGDRAIVGAVWFNVENECGGSYLFDRGEQGEWVQSAKLLASDETTDDRFGCALGLTDRFAVVGAEGQRTNVREGGAVYVFDLKEE